ncbi:hypothetical protein RRG08_009789 [Elysia crispata]|uniref:Uncharacterized protein n=1 Tax=Elysia crispata TaxID=231223 RepID=A0AAE0ZR59_9GAST|nr:hypothetical protein RRG08_009789 [Elysia crispata]
MFTVKSQGKLPYKSMVANSPMPYPVSSDCSRRIARIGDIRTLNGIGNFRIVYFRIGGILKAGIFRNRPDADRQLRIQTTHHSTNQASEQVKGPAANQKPGLKGVFLRISRVQPDFSGHSLLTVPPSPIIPLSLSLMCDKFQERQPPGRKAARLPHLQTPWT